MTERERIIIPEADFIGIDLNEGNRIEVDGQVFYFEKLQEYSQGKSEAWYHFVIRRASDGKYFWTVFGEVSAFEGVEYPDDTYVVFWECFPHHVVTKVFKDFKE